ncbi:MAG: Xaa-Pro peptidase family protein [Firmicutes bacterium]|jgi:Xaa-Pro aminopeptidase|nr:Xaa-Pro peptidase family protein [Bacillota bacterium]
MLRQQYQRVQDTLRTKNLDGLLAISMENVYWLSEALIKTQKSIPDRLAVVLCPLGEHPTMLVCSIEESLVRRDTWISDLRTYVEFAQSPVSAVADIMRSRGLDRGRVGIEKGYVCALHYEEFLRELPGVAWVDVSADFERMRMIKTPREIEIIRHAAVSTEKAIMEAFRESKPGDTERAVVNRIILKTLEAGADAASGTFGAGPKSAIAHPFADDSPLRPGDIVSVDFGGEFRGYHSDLGRTAVVDKPSDRQERLYTQLYDIQRRLIDGVRPGVKACELFRKADEWMRRAGIPISLPHVGHGLGLALHEYPLLSPFNEEPLQEDMVINIEPFHVADEGYHAEDTMVVRKDGAELLSDFADHSRIIRIRGGEA